MSRFSVSPDQLFDRPWRAGHPFRPRCGRIRRCTMILLLLLLCLVIGGYGYLTDSNRVRQMAETYLSRLVGGRVEVRKATLSVFEGLRLEDVKVHVDEDVGAADSLIFSAQTFIIRYDPRTMLAGQLEASQIVVEKPRVHLTQNVQTGAWNFHRMGHSKGRRPRPTGIAPARPIPIPEILLRNAQVEVNELRGTRQSQLGAMAIDGHVSPAPDGEHYAFELQSRGSEGVGPFVSGTVALSTGRVDAQLRHFYFGEDFEFGRDVQSMLPEDVREWWERHALSGRLDIPVLQYVPPHNGSRAAFKVETELDGVTLTVRPEEWTAAQEVDRARTTIAAIRMVRPLYAAAGYSGGSGAQDARPGGDGAEIEGRAEVGAGSEADDKREAEANGTAGTVASGPRGGSAVLLISPAPAGSVLPPGLPRAPSPAASARLAADGSATGTPLDHMELLIEGSPVTLRQVAGTLLFTESGIDVRNVSGRVENNAFKISGRIDGYRPESPARLRIASLDTENLYIPPSPRYVNSLPRQVREIYDDVRPQGTCRMEMEVERRTPGARPRVRGELEVLNGQFCFDKFAYPLRDATGRITFGPDPVRGTDFVQIVGMRARGGASGANRDSYLTVDGKIGPLESDTPDPGFDIHVSGDGIWSEPALRQAFPPEVQQAMRIFTDPSDAESPHYHGKFSTHVLHREGGGKHWTFDTDIRLDDANGTLAAFPYPMRHVTGVVKVRDGYVDIEGVRMRRGDATLTLDGRVVWDESLERRMAGSRAAGTGAGKAEPPAPSASTGGPLARPMRTELSVAVRGLPLDDELAAALPADRKQWLRKLGLTGKLDIDGILTQPPPAPRVAAARPVSEGALAVAEPDRPLAYDLSITLRGGALHPAGLRFGVSEVEGGFHVTPDCLRIDELHGVRGKAALALAGEVTWSDDRPQLALRARATNLELDAPLYELLPADGRASWDELQPEGTLDAELSYVGLGQTNATTANPTDRVRPDSLAHPLPAIPAAPVAPSAGNLFPAPAHAITSPLPAPAPASAPPGFHAVVRPRNLALTPRSMPYRFEGVKGTVTLAEEQVTLAQVTASHGTAVFTVSGSGQLGERPTWDLRLGGEGVKVDPAFRAALPTALQGLVTALKVTGVTDFRFSRLLYRAPPASAIGAGSSAASSPRLTPAGPTTAPHPVIGDGQVASSLDPSPVLSPPVALPSPEPEIDLTATIALKSGSLDAGVPLTDVTGQIQLEAAVREGHLASVKGKFDVSRLTMAGRTLRNFKADLVQVPERNELQLDKMQAELAGGAMAGRMSLVFPDDGASHYTLDLVLRNADVRELARETDQDIRGALTASLSLEGVWGDPTARRGRGDVTMEGKEMYKIPLVLGLLQVTNLALPIAEPFHHGMARYSLDGQRVNFEKVELRSDTMVMSGSGHLDFGTKQVRMSFVTDNPGGLKVPFLRDLWQGARNELLKINVKGTIEEPKVETSVMGTFTTTIDEVFRGDGNGKK